jgi:hypothetical protein
MLPDGSPYLTPVEAAYCAVDATDKALGAVIAQLFLLALEQQQLHKDLDDADDDTSEAIEWRLRQLHNEERSLHRIESGLQSRLRSGQGQ